MIGIMLSLEQLREAPLEVRQWIEREIATALGQPHPTPALEQPRHLVACSVEEAREILGLIQGLLPAATVFFELGREPAVASPQGLRALRLNDLLRHARLQAPEQLVACLAAINEAAQHLRGEPGAVLASLEPAGYCLVADATARSILALWQQIAAADDLARPIGRMPQASLHATLPPFRTAYPTAMPMPVPGEHRPGANEQGVAGR